MPERTGHAPLPRGGHGLSRDEVVASQRGRLLTAAAEVAAEKGYAATSVADVLKRARVSRLTFYENFANKEACFTAGYDMVADELLRRIGEALQGDGDMVERGERALSAYLGALAEEPVLARFFLVESYAAPALMERRFAMHRSIAHLLAAELGAATEGQRVACEAFVGAVIALVTNRITSGHPGDVTALQPHILDLSRAVWDNFPNL